MSSSEKPTLDAKRRGRETPPLRGGCRSAPPARSLARSPSALPRVAAYLHLASGHGRHRVIPTAVQEDVREAHISAQQPASCKEARLPGPDGHPRRPRRAEEPSRQGPRPPVGLITRIRSRDAFVRLQREGRRVRRSALWCTWCPDPTATTTSVAFALSRALGSAVSRNRLRRRLRAILTTIELPPGLLLIGATPAAITLTFDQLRLNTIDLMSQLTPDCSR